MSAASGPRADNQSPFSEGLRCTELIDEFLAAQPSELVFDYLGNIAVRQDREGHAPAGQARILHAAAATITARLHPHLEEVLESERREFRTDPNWCESPGLPLTAAIALYRKATELVFDIISALERGRTTAGWALLSCAAPTLRALTDLAHDKEPIAYTRRLAGAASFAHVELRAAVTRHDLHLPPPVSALAHAGIRIAGPATVAAPLSPGPIAAFLSTLECCGKVVDALPHTAVDPLPENVEFNSLVTGTQAQLTLELLRHTTITTCSVIAGIVADGKWNDWTDDIAEALDTAENHI